MTDTLIKDNAAKSRFEMEVDGQVVFATYRRAVDTIHILHVEAPPSLRGTGAAGRFMQALMEQMRLEKMRVVPVCGYAVSWLQRHGEFSDILAV